MTGAVGTSAVGQHEGRVRGAKCSSLRGKGKQETDDKQEVRVVSERWSLGVHWAVQAPGLIICRSWKHAREHSSALSEKTELLRDKRHCIYTFLYMPKGSGGTVNERYVR